MFWNKTSRRPSNLTETLAQGLQKTWPETQLKPASSDDPVESIIVPILAEADRPAFYLKLSLASSGYAAMKKMGDPDLSVDQGTFSEFDYLQFYIPLPIQISADTVNDIAILIERINSKLPLMGFNLAQSDEMTVSYRHMMLFESQRPNFKLVERSVTLISFLVSEFFPTLKAVSTGAKRLSELDV
ncbi:MAG: hypothetical protein AAF921_22265 [Cyanobacteria bacterium P01_D01_bin.44]